MLLCSLESLEPMLIWFWTLQSFRWPPSATQHTKVVAGVMQSAHARLDILQAQSTGISRLQSKYAGAGPCRYCHYSLCASQADTVILCWELCF
jgi:hypothetical protein